MIESLFFHLGEGIRATATWIWGAPMLLFLAGVGLFFSFRLGWLQIRKLPEAARLTFLYRKGEGEGDISPLQSLYSALGGLIGNGNLAGVATAIALGGPGAVFWLIAASLVAMIIVYVETLLAVDQRERMADGWFAGGPMYYIRSLLGLPWLAGVFAAAMGLKTILATATIQSNSIAIAFHSVFPVPLLGVCIVLAFLTWIVVVGGLQSIARFLEKVTPFMVILYLVAGLSLCLFYWRAVPETLGLILASAFQPAPAMGGFAGATLLMALRYGVARGFYSNEAGTGSSPIIYSSARSSEPRKLAQIAMFGVVIDTLVGVLTALVILLTGVWMSGQTSTALTSAAFGAFLGPVGGPFILLCSFLFGYSTLIAWCFYGEQCFVYLIGPRVRFWYRWIFCLAIVFGFFEAEIVWSWGDLLNATTVVINVSAISFLLSHVLRYSRRGRPSPL